MSCMKSIQPQILRFKFHQYFDLQWRSLQSSKDIRTAFIKFYQEKDHTFVPSSKVFSQHDKSLLFVNAGMNQFKPIILGKLDQKGFTHNLKRAVNSQRCIRAGGKHNDLEDVGSDLSHHTFFEMLGSWSFGDYFKGTACKLAWEFLTEVCNLAPNRLYVTYFGGSDVMKVNPDTETRDIWLSMGIAPERILPFGTKENFWEMGETGPCGPCTEIHYDRNIEDRFAPQEVNVNNSDIVEIWNIVFMQYNRVNNHSLENLHSFHVDTGMGLERISGILLGNKSNYDTDLFMPIISKLEMICACRPYNGEVGERDLHGVGKAYRIVSDHIRMLTISIADGVYPGLRDRNLIVRQVLRRAVRSGIETLEAPRMFLSSLVPAVVTSLACSYPGLKSKQHLIMEVIDEAEREFYDIIDKGNEVIKKEVSKLNPGEMFPVRKMAKILHNGYPLEYIKNHAFHNNLTFDNNELKKLIEPKKQEKIKNIKQDNKTIDINLLKVEKHLHDLKVPKTELVAVPSSKESRISANCVAIISNSGVVETKKYQWNSKCNPVYILFDKSFDCSQSKHLVSDMLSLEVEEMKYPIAQTHDISAWSMYQLLPSESLPTLSTITIGQPFIINIDKERWKSANCAYVFCDVLSNTLRHLWKTAVILKSRTKFNKFIVEIAGYYTSSDIIKLCNTTKQTAEQDQYSLVECELCITKVNHQGKAKTVLHALTGSRAKDALEKTKQIQMEISQIVTLANNKNLEPENILAAIKTIGVLKYRLNSEEISFDAKENYRTTLQNLSRSLRLQYSSADKTRVIDL